MSSLPSPKEFEDSAFLYEQNLGYLDALYQRYQRGEILESEWLSFFKTFPAQETNVTPVIAFKRENSFQRFPVSQNTREENPTKAFQVLRLIEAYRTWGHLKARLDPLGLTQGPGHPALALEAHDLQDSDLHTSIEVQGALGFKTASLKDIQRALEATYCGAIGVEYMHIDAPDRQAWIRERIEVMQGEWAQGFTGQKNLLQELRQAEAFEKFLHVKFVGAKRFGLDGGESLIPAISALIDTSVACGVQEIIFGMPHRGRLNVLANIFKKPLGLIFSEFQGKSDAVLEHGSGDVKYHLGYACDVDRNGKKVHLSLASNPSHLEAVDPVVLGKVRAKQQIRDDHKYAQVMGLIMHGDAAFAGQGIVAETLMLSQLSGYKTGGTFHLVVNNQIGFTTNPSHSRSSVYCTDIGKMIQVPIFHVNGDDPEAVLFVTKLAAEFRHTFKSDVIVDLVCYRRNGHNESDEPAFTQPTMYKAIHNQPSVATLYSQKLLNAGHISADNVKAMDQEIQKNLQESFENVDSILIQNKSLDWMGGMWQGLDPLSSVKLHDNKDVVKGASLQSLKEIGTLLTEIPSGFNLNPKLVRLLGQKKEMFTQAQGIDWATGEALAFGSLLRDGFPIRLSGQDCGRGTFSHRHAVLVDQENQETYTPLQSIRATDQSLDAAFNVWDSPLSEAAVLGFEYGYTLAMPRALVLWEAQFGDFANGAQVIIDQFIASSGSKWLRFSGLVMLLPHGYEGQGPEHSSARLERYLQLAAEGNIQVAYPSTPANYYHILRRQIKRNFRKPLILMTPKSLLRHQDAVSTLSEFDDTHHFAPVIFDAASFNNPEKIEKIVFCSGKIYYDLLAAQKAQGLEEKIALVRLEELYPFPGAEIKFLAEMAPKAHLCWCQEEPKNMGAWTFLAPFFQEVLSNTKRSDKSITCVARPASASPSTGFLKQHQQEQEILVNAALRLNAADNVVRK